MSTADNGGLLHRVYIVGATKSRVREVEAMFRTLKADTGFECERETFVGFDGLEQHLERYVNLVIFNYRDVPPEKFKSSLRVFRDLYSGRMVLVNSDPSVHPCIWGRFYGMNYQAATAEELRPYVERALMQPATRGRTAIVFAGGGILGGFAEIGVYKALCDLGLREFDMYIGLSAGAYVATVAAHGIPPDVMVEHRGLGLLDFYNPNIQDAAKKILFLVPNLINGAAKYLSNPSSDILFLLSSLFPAAALTGNRLGRVLAKQLRDARGTNSFRRLRKRNVELYITAMDLDSAELRTFGTEDDLDVPIADAVRASAALPLAYKPVEIDGRHYVDGGIHTTANIDVAIAHGADLIICVNPLVPYKAEDAGTIQQLGPLGVLEQSFRIALYQRLQRDLQYYRRAHPRCKVLLIEPDLHEAAMFHNPLHANAELIDLAVTVGYESCRRFMEREWDFVERSFFYHGRPASRDVVDRVSHTLQEGDLSHEALMDAFTDEGDD